MDKATAEKVTEQMRRKGWDVLVDDTKRVTRITAKRAAEGQGGSLSYITSQVVAKAVVDKLPEA